MNLYDEEELKLKNEKNRKVRKFVIIGIFISIIIIALLTGTILYLLNNPNKIKINANYIKTSDGKKQKLSGENIKLEKYKLEKTKLDGEKVLYFPIRATANLFGYENGNGDTGANPENNDICNVKITDENNLHQETSIFTLDSTTIYKITNPDSLGEKEYEEIKLENPIIKENGTLYVDLYGLGKAFNMKTSYNKQKKTVNISTLPYLIDNIKNEVKKIGTLDEKYINKKALLDDIIIILKNDSTKGARRYNNINDEILQFEYSDINYIPQNGLFFVKKGNLVGIYDKQVDKETGQKERIPIKYENLNLIDAENELYLAKENGLYGVIDKKGNTVIYSQYTKIGVDIAQYDENGLKNGYVLLGKIIPVYENNKWKFFRIKKQKNIDGTISTIGSQIQNFECESIGCITKSLGTTSKNLMVIPEYNLIVVKKQQTYGLMNFTGALPIPAVLKDVYIATISGKRDYYMVGIKDGKEHTWNITEQIQKMGYKKIE